jgi:hypothetical protein
MVQALQPTALPRPARTQQTFECEIESMGGIQREDDPRFIADPEQGGYGTSRAKQHA